MHNKFKDISFNTPRACVCAQRIWMHSSMCVGMNVWPVFRLSCHGKSNSTAALPGYGITDKNKKNANNIDDKAEKTFHRQHGATKYSKTGNACFWWSSVNRDETKSVRIESHSKRSCNVYKSKMRLWGGKEFALDVSGKKWKRKCFKLGQTKSDTSKIR